MVFLSVNALCSTFENDGAASTAASARAPPRIDESRTTTRPGIVVVMTKADLHRLVDELPDASVDPVARVLERAKDPVIAVLDAAPWDDEPFTAEEQAAVAAALADPTPGIPLADVERELGL
jgi:hypothetical protein